MLLLLSRYVKAVVFKWGTPVGVSRKGVHLEWRRGSSLRAEPGRMGLEP